MDDLSPRARALLEAAYGADDPLPSDALRVQRGVLVRVSAAGVGAAVFSFSLQRAQALLGAAAPKLVAVVALAVGGSALYQHARSKPAPHAVSSIVPARLVAPPPAAPAAPLALRIESLAMLAAPEATPRAVPARPQRKLVALKAASPAADLEAEMRWVRAADAALRTGDASGANALLDNHAREFPSGALAEEREGLRLLAACQAGSEEGKRQAARFLERSPRSLLAGRLRASCPRPLSTGD